jgi:beta-glucanase (GH16 family)
MKNKILHSMITGCAAGVLLMATAARAAEAPYGGTPAAVPGTVQAENYDTGGQGVAYNVTSVNGTANSYRSDGVDLEVTTDTGGGYDLGWTAVGQWFKYTVNVATAGTYTVTFRVSAESAIADAFHISNSAGTNLSGSVAVPDTGAWQTWTSVTAKITLPAGMQTLTVNQDNPGWNLNWFSFALMGEGPYGGTPAAIPGTVMAENYDTGGQGVGYNVTSVNGTDNAYRSDGVDLETASAPATGNDLGWTAAGQWFRYTVNVSTAGTYKVTILVAAESAIADAFHIANSAGTNLTGSVAVPDTGAWQTWTTVTATLTLPAGVQTLTLDQDAGGWNIDSMAFAASGVEGPYGGTPAAIPGEVLAENYDTGGSGVGYYVTSTNGTDNAYRSDGIDLETTSAPGGGNDVGWTAAGQWFRYTVNVATAGTYTVTFEVASPNGVTDGLHLSNSSGTNLTGSVNVPETGGWQDWTTVTATLTLPAGQQVLTWNQDNAGYNLYSMSFAAGSGGGTGNCSGVSNITVNGTTYTPSFCQEFNGAVGSAIDTTVWNFDLGNNGGWGNGEAEVYCGPPGYAGNPSQCPTTFSTSTAPVYIDGNGHLVIQPIYENGAWLSARMETSGKQNVTYGILEASIQAPNTTNQGLWPAWWALGSDYPTVGWPDCGESDIMELWSSQVDNGPGPGGNNSTIHTEETGGDGIGDRYTFPGGESNDTAFHTYGIVWTQNQMQFFVDNPATPFFTVTPSSLPSGDTWPFNQAMYMLLNVAVGGTLGGSDAGLASPAGAMTVDYVRWYTPQ